jgi:hypothetical protein
MMIHSEWQERREEREKRKVARDYARLREEQAGRGSLLNFVRYYWHVLEPIKRKFIEGWPIDAIALHLEAITFGDINRLLINVPPGFMKSLMVNVFWPAWEWGPMNMPYLRHLAFSYAQDLTARDNNKLVKLVTSRACRRSSTTRAGDCGILSSSASVRDCRRKCEHRCAKSKVGLARRSKCTSGCWSIFELGAAVWDDGRRCACTRKGNPL